ncbi:GNAT family N-acetyltransferase [Allofournierella sp.]|uniref:GNAT family N-acetyltransferase n=1 Tax=Allofournierella sp. TaxID=1940256 RepID=UPI003AB6165E
MSLLIKAVTSDFEDIKALESLNNEAFPKEERMEICEMMQLISKQIIEVTAVYDDDTFVGFYALSVRKPIAYVFFLAIDSTKRSRGYGSKALALMKEQYADYQIVLDMERLDEDADNIEQRKSRKRFYLRNGYYETGFFLDYNDLIMEVLCTDAKLNADSFRILLENIKIRETPFVLVQMNLNKENVKQGETI